MTARRVIVVGAGIAGLVAAVDLAARGVDVTVLERAAVPGGKMRRVIAGGLALDAGPTVFTMRRVFEEIFADAGETLRDHVTLRQAQILARHAWGPHERLDLFADQQRSADAIGAFAGAREASGYRRFCANSRAIFATLEPIYMRSSPPNVAQLVARAGPAGLAALARTKPFTTLWRELPRYFADPRLRQLFGRYTTYCGSSPFLAPATLMLIAHVEQDGVWHVEGGMHELALALMRLARKHGARFRFGAEALRLGFAGARPKTIEIAGGEQLDADAFIFNADISALAAGMFGPQAARAGAGTPVAARSLSAVTWMIAGRASGFALSRHNVFFSRDYAAEFSDIFTRGRLPAEPTVYVCAQDRGDEAAPAHVGPERLFCLVNAPPLGDRRNFDPAEIAACANSTFAQLQRCGLTIEALDSVEADPAGFNQLFPATGGALYGRASHGWAASFSRMGARSRIPGLYLAGGSVHPGAGVPMAALSGRMAARATLADFASTGR